jgi:hypothetical protein
MGKINTRIILDAQCPKSLKSVHGKISDDNGLINLHVQYRIPYYEY